MSAIYGLYDLNKNEFNHEKALKLDAGYDRYKFDKSNVYKKQNLFLGAKQHFFTEEAKREILPFYDEENKIAITADAIIDNRAELIEILNLAKDATDSQLILNSYLRWQEECVQHLIGDFAFVIYDQIKERLFAARDHVGKRTFYYIFKENEFAFSTSIKPLAEMKSVLESLMINEKWLVDYLAIEGAISSIALNETVYKDIRQLPPAHYMMVSRDGIAVKQYWFPEKVARIKMRDEEYVEKFKEVYKEAVECRLRTADNIGIMLSSGLDSTSVAAFAASKLKEENKELQSFTWVPVKGYISDLSRSQMIDESSYVKEFVQDYDNIKPHFCSFSDQNSYTNINELISEFNNPYKFVENAYWANEIFKEAKKQDCIILLDGQFGNFTISKGNFITYIYTLVKHLHFVTANREINSFSEFYEGDPKVARKVLAKKILKNNNLVNAVLKIKNNTRAEEDISLASLPLREMWKTNERLKEIGLSIDDNKILDCTGARRYITNLVLFAHMGAVETEASLYTGVCRRDPTRDKRVIEFCLSIPEDQYVKEGRERILVRRALKGMVTDKILDNYLSRGKQSADWIQRISPYKEEIFKEAEDIAAKSKIYKYLNIDYFKKIIEIEKSKEKNNTINMRKIMIVIIANRFLENAI